MGGPAPHDVYAAIDIGSNTVHLLVARSDGRGVEPLYDTSKMLRLGVDLEQYGALSAAKLRAAAETTRTYVERARAAGAESVLVLATQAVRAAANRDEAVAVIQAASAAPVRVLEPEREARLAGRAATFDQAWHAPYLVVDVGGASTQLIVATADGLQDYQSIPVGSGRLGVYLADDPPAWTDIAAVQQRVGVAVVPALAALLAGREPPVGAVIMGGASHRVARLLCGMRPPARLALADLLGGLGGLLGQPADVLAGLSGIKPNRVTMTRVGALILADVLRAARLADCVISPHGIREGAILDAASEYRAGALPRGQ